MLALLFLIVKNKRNEVSCDIIEEPHVEIQMKILETLKLKQMVES